MTVDAGNNRQRKLTTTSYVVLGLLAIKPWSAYELAAQMSRGVKLFWARAESNAYAEPKRLVALELATSEHSYTGRRRTTTYSITPEGRTRLQEWLRTDSGPPVFESETLLKVWFAENGSKQRLLEHIESVRRQGLEARGVALERARELSENGGIFPHRVHINALITDLLLSQAELAIRWAERARDEVSLWRDTKDSSRGAAFFETRALKLHPEDV